MIFGMMEIAITVIIESFFAWLKVHLNLFAVFVVCKDHLDELYSVDQMTQLQELIEACKVLCLHYLSGCARKKSAS